MQVGMAKSHRVAVLPEGELADAVTATGEPLALDLATADVEGLLLKAAAAIAHQQLGVPSAS